MIIPSTRLCFKQDSADVPVFVAVLEVALIVDRSLWAGFGPACALSGRADALLGRYGLNAIEQRSAAEVAEVDRLSCAQ